MLGEMLENVRAEGPLIHNITNYVTVNDCANILLACGASPIMADDEGEVEEITTICSGLIINIGTLNERTINSMFMAGVRANEVNHPVVLDPVGAGASALRTETALELMSKIDFTVIRGNMSEMKALFTGAEDTKGVDVDLADMVDEDNLEQSAAMVKKFAAKAGCILAVSGAIDIVADASRAYCVRNGDKMMSRITGAGCQLSALTAAFVAANPGNEPEAVAAAFCAMGLSGQIARKRMGISDGNSSYRDYLIDAVYNLTPEELDAGAEYEMR